MKMFHFTVVCSFVLGLFLFAVTASAQFRSGDRQPVYNSGQDACAGASTVDECMWSPMSGGTKYASCTASAKTGEVCQNYSYANLNCVQVKRSAYCFCDDSTQYSSWGGTCTYTP